MQDKDAVSLLIGKKTSAGVPGKNIMPMLGRPLCEYALIAASKSKSISHIYVSTDCPVIASVGEKYSATLIERPEHLHDPETLTEDVLIHAYETIVADRKGKEPSCVNLLYSNGPFISPALIDTVVNKLLDSPHHDSCVGVYKADMYTPIRARTLGENGEVSPFCDLSLFDNISSQRDSAGSAYFVDPSLQVLKPSCFKNGMNGNQPPFLWLGNRILGHEIEVGFDVDAEWQISIVKDWLLRQGFDDISG